MNGNPTHVSTVSSLETSDLLSTSTSADIDPIVTLFDNAIWRRHGSDRAAETPWSVDGVRVSVAANKRVRTREALLSNIIAPELRDMIINATCSWWHTWKPLGSRTPISPIDKTASTLPDFVLSALKSPDPSIIGIAILCVAVCLQQLDTRVHHTEEGIEVIVFSAKIYMNLGQNRKCWILTHQAIAYSQLLSHHRPTRLSPYETSTQIHHRTQSWLSLCSSDVYLSLLLGLPYAADGRTIPLTQNKHNLTALFHHNLTLLSAKVIDRNQNGQSLSVPHTMEIQTELDLATKNLSDAFWSAPTSLAASNITREEYLEQIAAQCWYYQLSVLLHMPLMIHAIVDDTLEAHRVACLSACRSLLKTYHIMRSDTYAAFGMVKLIDYQAFVCSALLILGLLGYGACRNENHGVGQSHDRDLISQAIATLRQASCTVNNPIARQAVQGLESLMSLGDSECPLERGGNLSGDPNLNPRAKIVVPYVGVITITPGEYYTGEKVLPTEKSVMSEGIQTGSLLRFTLSDDSFEGCYGSLPQTNFEADKNLQNRDKVGLGGENDDDIQMELTSIDFDWASTLTTNFEDDWAWLNELGH
ncbi:hypothetical protein EYC84_006169 [Monilinia fructicola]|uniref:Transcription factor domain-containing protein n=1 Tax=Monilinia fructicola TaxID=38448 RepID=A0A5M9K707_MONFR|nr:hypothetical protein EYC84_006169 [Monilinia fructicola]